MKLSRWGLAALLSGLSLCSSAMGDIVVALSQNPDQSPFATPYEYEYNQSTGAAASGFTPVLSGSEGIDALAVSSNSTIYNFDDIFGNEYLQTVNGFTGQILATSNDLSVAAGNLMDAGGATFGPDGYLYVSAQSPTAANIYRINPSFTNGGNATVSSYMKLSGTTPSGIGNIAFGADDNLYFNGYVTGPPGVGATAYVWKYNTTTDTLSTLIDLGLDNYSDGLAFGPDGNLFVSDDNGIEEYTLGGTFEETFIATSLQAIQFGPDGDLYGLNDLDLEVLRYNGSTGAFLNDAGNLPTDSQPSAIALVPEPSCLVPLLGGIALLCRKPRRQFSTGD
jgi:hypothetical protein